MMSTFATRPDEDNLIRRYQRGDNAAGTALLRHHEGLVRHIVRPFFKKAPLDRDDLLQEGRLGFLIGCERFDFSHGVKLSTYAAWWIRARVRDAILASRVIAIPAGVVEALRAGARLGVDTASPEAMVAAGLLQPGHVALKSAAFMGKPKSLDAPARGSAFEEVSALVDLIPGDYATPEEEVIARQSERHAKAEIDAITRDLDPRSLDVLRRRHLRWRGEEPLTVVAEHHGVSRQRVSQIEHAVLDTLTTRAKVRRKMGTDARAW